MSALPETALMSSGPSLRAMSMSPFSSSSRCVGGLGDVAHDHALESWRALPVALVGVERAALVGLPGAQLERPRAGRVGLQPLVAHVAGLLVLHHQLDVDDRADAGGQAVEDEGGRVGLVELQPQRAGRRVALMVSAHVVGLEAELGEDEARRLVELDHPLQRVGDVLGGQRVAGVELDAVADLEGEGQAVVADRPALGHAGPSSLATLSTG